MADQDKPGVLGECIEIHTRLDEGQKNTNAGVDRVEEATKLLASEFKGLREDIHNHINTSDRESERALNSSASAHHRVDGIVKALWGIGMLVLANLTGLVVYFIKHAPAGGP